MAISTEVRIHQDITTSFYFTKEILKNIAEEIEDEDEKEKFKSLIPTLEDIKLHDVSIYFDDYVDIDEDDIEDLIEEAVEREQSKNHKYQERNNQNTAFINKDLIYRIEQIAYNFGNTKPLTNDEMKQLERLLKDIE